MIHDNAEKKYEESKGLVMASFWLSSMEMRHSDDEHAFYM